MAGEIFISHTRSVTCPEGKQVQLTLNSRQIIASEETGNNSHTILASRSVFAIAGVEPIHCAGCSASGCHITVKTHGGMEAETLASFNSASIELLPPDHKPKEVPLKSRIHT